MTKEKSRVSSMRTMGVFLSGRACSDTLFHVVNHAFDQPMKTEETAVMPFAGGIMQHGYQCGMLWGATLAAGAQAYRLCGPGPRAETKAVMAAQRIVESFQARNNTINCMEITDLDSTSTTMQMIVYFVFKGGTIGCLRRAGQYAPSAFDEIQSALEEEPAEMPPAPVSCAAMVARKMGASEMHVAMAAGLAGGIGLSGGACGALGAAIWILGMNRIAERGGKLEYKSAKSLEAIDLFLKCSDYEFECSEIVGRKFESIADHAAYLRDGGCGKIIDLLAAQKSNEP